jgi:hypothetical protein
MRQNTSLQLDQIFFEKRDQFAKAGILDGEIERRSLPGMTSASVSTNLRDSTLGALLSKIDTFKLDQRTRAFASPFGKGGLRGILQGDFNEQFGKSPLAPLFQRGEFIPGGAKENTPHPLPRFEKTKQQKNKFTESRLSIGIQTYFGQQWARGDFVSRLSLNRLACSPDLRHHVRNLQPVLGIPIGGHKRVAGYAV